MSFPVTRLVTPAAAATLRRMIAALALIVVAAGWRLLTAPYPALANFAPVMALTFCGAVYFRDRRMWLVPFVALTLSDLFLDPYYSQTFRETWLWPSVLVRLICFALALPIGTWVARHKNWMNLFGGALASSLIFYVATNTDAWVRDPYYAKTAAGWLQAMTTGRPEFPPTIWFFKNTLVSDLLFTGMFAGAMELAARRAGRESLLRRSSAA